MSSFKQYSFQLQSPKDGVARVVSIKSHPFHRGSELVNVVNQGGKIKIHAVVDEDKPKEKIEFLVAGTGSDIPENLANRIHKIGTVLISDGQFGYHFYMIQGDYNHLSSNNLTVKITCIDSMQSIDTIKNNANDLYDKFSDDIEITWNDRLNAEITITGKSIGSSSEYLNFMKSVYDQAEAISVTRN